VARKGEEVEKGKSEAKESQSFTMNLFRGVVETAQVFPFPQVLNEEQTDNLKMLVDPTAKFFEVCMCCIRQCTEEKVMVFLYNSMNILCVFTYFLFMQDFSVSNLLKIHYAYLVIELSCTFVFFYLPVLRSSYVHLHNGNITSAI